MNAIQAVSAVQPVAGGVSTQVNSCLYELAAAVHQVQRNLTGAPSEALVEKARRELGRISAISETIRRQLPDPNGLRTGTGAQRAVRAVACFMTEFGAFPTEAMAAAMMEVSPSEARGLLLRAQLKGWTRVVEVTDGRPHGDRWGLTPAGREFTGFKPPALPANAPPTGSA